MRPSRFLQLAGLFVLFSGIAHAQQCIHGSNETPQQKQRRIDAVNAMRRINTAEFQNMPEAKKFVSFAELVSSKTWSTLNAQDNLRLSSGAMDLLPGFELHLTTDGISYSMSLTDKTDPCLFTLYSSNSGIIYTGYPIDFLVMPTKP